MANLAAADDAELLELLRSGESDAYTELWRRHIKAALRVAQRVAPGQAEDLASESFLRVYRQVTTTDSGPRDAFRAYLFTVIRNTAMRWQREGQLVDTDPEIEQVELRDGLSQAEDRLAAADMLEAFERLPERWQRVLWLTEIEQVGRAAVAAELAIKPNAVSALHRRARKGLRAQWLLQQVPAQLREDPGHAARLLPAYLSQSALGHEAAEVKRHLGQCPRCRELERELRASTPPLGKGALSLAGFAALGVVLPTASQLSLAGAGAGAAGTAFGVAGAAVAVAAGVVLLAGGALTTTVLLGKGTPSEEQRGSECVSVDCAVTGERDPDKEADRERAEEERLTAPEEVPLLLGRGNSDESIAVVGFGGEAPIDDYYLPPERPTPAPPGTIPEPLPGEEGEGGGQPPASEPPGTPGRGENPTAPLPPGDEDPGSNDGKGGAVAPGGESASPGEEAPVPLLTAGLSTPRAFEGYLAPVIGGTATVGASVAIEVVFRPEESWQSSWTERFAVTPAVDGRWSFDMRALAESQYGGYDYRVWAFTEDAVSQAASGAFTVSRPLILGFEDMAFLDLAESSTSGVVFEVRGPTLGTICLTSVYSGQTAEIPLNERGEAVRRMRMLSGGAYYFVFRACAEQHRGPAAEVLFDVFDPDGPIFGPWGPDPAETVFVLEEVEEEAAPGEEAEGGNPSEPGAGETVAEPSFDTQTIP